MTERRNDSLTDVPGVRVGHAVVPGGGSGCTVVLGPFRARAEVGGMATGTRELGVLAEEHLVSRVDALLLTGGSAFGLAAADGVVAWLDEEGWGHPTAEGPVPIVPGAVIFDLADDREVPGPGEGWAACEGAGDGPVPGGRVGAGAGALVGKLLGRAHASPGGLGSAALGAGSWTVGALAVVNPVGDVLDREGRIVAGARREEGFADGTSLLLEAGEGAEPFDLSAPRPGENTTLAVVATDAPLGRTDLRRLARMASTALSRRITPAHTPFDGDVVFAVSTAAEEEPVDPARLLRLGVVGREALETAILRAVSDGEGEE